MRKLSSTEVIRELLRTYQDVTATLNSVPDWIGDKPGSRVLLRPEDHPYFTGSYRQLETVLRFMRDGGTSTNNRDRKKVQAKYWAVNATYLSCEYRLVDAYVKRKAKGHKQHTAVERRSEPIGPKVPARDLEAGINWIATEFTRRNLQPWLPPEILALATAARADGEPERGIVGYAA